MSYATKVQVLDSQKWGKSLQIPPPPQKKKVRIISHK